MPMGSFLRVDMDVPGVAWTTRKVYSAADKPRLDVPADMPSAASRRLSGASRGRSAAGAGGEARLSEAL
jgi:hypothetical protein